MSRHFIIDGYNLIYSISEFESKSLEQSRLNLIQFIVEHKPQGSVRNQVTVVFDGQPDVFGGADSVGLLNIVFTSGETADHRIKSIVQNSGNPKECVVVSNDREIQLFVKALGAKILTVLQFYGLRVKNSSSIHKGKSNLSENMQESINAELRNVWLKKKNS